MGGCVEASTGTRASIPVQRALLDALILLYTEEAEAQGGEATGALLHRSSVRPVLAAAGGMDSQRAHPTSRMGWGQGGRSPLAGTAWASHIPSVPQLQPCRALKGPDPDLSCPCHLTTR